MLNRKMYDEISELSRNQHFRNACLVSEQKENEAYYQELVLRFFCQADYDGPDAELPEEYGEYITSWTRRAAELYGTAESKIQTEIFDRTFRLLSESLGDDAFRRWDGTRHLGPFSIASFEFVTSGVVENIEIWESRTHEALRGRVERIWSASDFRENSGSGMSPRRRVPKLVLRARTFFAGLE
jgi:hypothetical protein